MKYVSIDTEYQMEEGSESRWERTSGAWRASLTPPEGWIPHKGLENVWIRPDLTPEEYEICTKAARWGMSR